MSTLAYHTQSNLLKDCGIDIRKEKFIMEEFLNDYVQMIAEANDIELTPAQLMEIVNNLESEEDMWDFVDMCVNEEIARATGGDE